MFHVYSILFTIPFLILGFACVKELRRECIFSLILMLAGMWLIKNPGYDLVGASRPEQTYVETVGVPMTILCNIHEEAPESLRWRTQDIAVLPVYVHAGYSEGTAGA